LPTPFRARRIGCWGERVARRSVRTTETWIERIENEFGFRIASREVIKDGSAGRGSFVAKAVTSGGEAFAVKSLFETPERQRFIVESERLLAERGVPLARPRQTLRGEWMFLHDGAPYALYEWADGAGAPLAEPEQLYAIVELAARFHKASAALPYPEGVKAYDHPDWTEEYEERLLSMERWLDAHGGAKRGKKRVIADSVPFFAKAGKRALKALRNSEYAAYRAGRLAPRTLVHGDLHHNNVIRSGKTLTLIDFEDVRFDAPSKDLLRIYSMYTKSRAFEPETFRDMLGRYERAHPLPKELRRIVRIDLGFPHIFERMLRKRTYRRMSEEKVAFFLEQERKKAEYVGERYLQGEGRAGKREEHL